MKVKKCVLIDEEAQRLLDNYEKENPGSKGFNFSHFCNQEIKKKLGGKL